MSDSAVSLELEAQNTTPDVEEKHSVPPLLQCQNQRSNSCWMECVFCGNQLPVVNGPGRSSTFRIRRRDVVLDHVRNYTEVPYRPYACQICDSSKTEFGTPWSFQNHMKKKHSKEQKEMQGGRKQEVRPYLESLSQLFANLIILNDEESKTSSDDLEEEPPSLKFLRDFKKCAESDDEDSNVDDLVEKIRALAAFEENKKKLSVKTEVIVKTEEPDSGYQYLNTEAVEAKFGSGIDGIIDIEIVQQDTSDQPLENICRVCYTLKKGSANVFATSEEKRDHARLHAKHLETEHSNEEFETVMLTCFGPITSAISPENCKDDSRSRQNSGKRSSTRSQTNGAINSKLVDPPHFEISPKTGDQLIHEGVVREIREKFVGKWGKATPLECSECSHKMPNVALKNIKHHAFSHLAVRPFGCAFCDFGANLAGNINKHTRSAHRGKKLEELEYLVDRREELDEEITEQLRQCYWAVLNY